MAWHRSHLFFIYSKVRCEVVFSRSLFSISTFRECLFDELAVQFRVKGSAIRRYVYSCAPEVQSDPKGFHACPLGKEILKL